MEVRKANRYNTTIVPSRSVGKRNKTTKIPTQVLKKEELTDASDQKSSF